MVPGHIWAPERCLGTFGHRKVVWAHIGTERVPGHIMALERCLGTYGYRNGAREQLEPEEGPRHIWALERCLDKYEHQSSARAQLGTRIVPGRNGNRKGAQAHMGTGKVPCAHMGTYGHIPGHIWTPEECLGTYSQRRVPGHILAPEGFPCTYWNQNGAQVRMGARMVPGYICAKEMVARQIWKLEMCLGSYGHWNDAWEHTGTRTYLDTVLILRHNWAPEHCPGNMCTGRVPGHICTP